MTNKSKFTREQEDHICYLIDEWYLAWKNKIVDAGQQHRLGFAKEDLKDRLCAELLDEESPF